MKKSILLVVCAIVLSVARVTASTPADDAISKMVDVLSNKGSYRVDVDIIVGDYLLSGYYEVSGDDYYLNIDNQELFGDSSVKYEVNNDRKEVVIDAVRTSSNGNILANPATAFNDILVKYKTELISDNQNIISVNLKPMVDMIDVSESIDIAIDKSTLLPVQIKYIMQGDQALIKIVKISKLTSTINSYNASEYADYEIIDFR